MINKFTFKKQPRETGLASVGHPYQITDIKHNKKVVGHIHPPTHREGNDFWKIWLAVIKKDILEDNNPNCTWKWVTLKAKFKEEPKARNFIKENTDKLLDIWDLHHFEDY